MVCLKIIKNIYFQDVFGKFSLDTLASCAFGINPKSFEDDSNYFVKCAARIFTTTTLDGIKAMTRFLPWGSKIHQALGIDIWKPKETKFFIKVIKDTIAKRRETGTRRNDMIDLMIDCMKNIDISDVNDNTESDQYENDMKMDHKKSKNKDITEDQVVATAMVLLVAGYDTTGMTLSFITYYLSQHPDAQTRLQEEIDEAFEDNNGKMPDYNTVIGLPYLEMCIFETLRMFSPVGVILRACVKPYTIPNTNIKLDKNDLILIPASGIHRDERFYPNPKQFNPENFSKEAKQSRSPYAFQGFGQGPRACIGMRFAMLEMKLALCELLHNFTFLPSQNNPKVFEVDPTSQLGYVKGGVWAKVVRRD